jgi:glycosyltransferase involved in cell wall biosynthesis
MKAFAEVHSTIPDSSLMIVGEGPEEANLKRLAGELQIGNQVDFRGKMSRDELDPIYNRSRVVVLPSVVKENCPLVVLEAMAAGRPVVASRLGGITELVREEESGYLVPYGDASVTAKALTRLFESDTLTDTLGQKGRERARTDYTIERHLSSILDLYERAVNGRERPKIPEQD